MACNVLPCRCVDLLGIDKRDEYLISKKLAHLIDDIFWNLGFKSADQCDKVLCQLSSVYLAHCLSYLLQARGTIPVAAWEQRRATIARTIDDLTESDFRALIRTGWSEYLEVTYGAENVQADAPAANDTEMLVVADDNVSAPATGN